MAVSVGEDWKTKRDMLLREVYGEQHTRNGFKIPSNKVFSKDKYDTFEMSQQALEVQAFQDFVAAAKGDSTVTFECKIRDEDGDIAVDWLLHDRFTGSTRQHMSRAVRIIYHLTDIRNCISCLKDNYLQSGRMVLIFVEEVEKFLESGLNEFVCDATDDGKLHSITALMRLCDAVEVPLRELVDFVHEVVDGCWVGGEMMNLISSRLNGPSVTFFHKVLSRTLESCHRLFGQWVLDWVNGNSLDADMYFEFCIWDLCKRSLEGTNAVMDKENPGYLTSVSYQKLGHKMDHDAFARRFVMVPQLCPIKFEPVLIKLVKSGKYRYVQELYMGGEDDDVQALVHNGETMSMIEDAFASFGHDLLRQLNRRHNLWDLVEQLPAYFWGVNNSWLQAFIHLTEDPASFQSMRIPAAGLDEEELCKVFRQALRHSPQTHSAEADPFRPRFQLTVPPQHVRDFWHQPSNELEQQKIVEIELAYHMDPSLQLLYPPSVFEPFRGLFRLSHALQRCIAVTLRMREEQRWFLQEPIPLRRRTFEALTTPADMRARFQRNRIQLQVLNSVLQFMRNFNEYVFTCVVPQETTHYVQKVREAHTVDQFIKTQQRMVDRIRQKSCTSEGHERLVQKLWYFIRYASALSRAEVGFERGCHLLLKTVKSMKKWVAVKADDRHLQVLGAWLFGSNLAITRDPDPALALLANLAVKSPQLFRHQLHSDSPNASLDFAKSTASNDLVNNKPLRRIQQTTFKVEV